VTHYAVVGLTQQALMPTLASTQLISRDYADPAYAVSLSRYPTVLKSILKIYPIVSRLPPALRRRSSAGVRKTGGG